MYYLRVRFLGEVLLVHTDPVGGDAESRMECESVFACDDALVITDGVFAGSLTAVALIYFIPLFAFAAFPPGEVAKR